MNIKLLLRASLLRFGLGEGCFFLRCVQDLGASQAREVDLWGAVKVKP